MSTELIETKPIRNIALRSASLPGGNDAKVAATALQLMQEANRGFLAAVALGFLCDWIKGQLGKRGGFDAWVETHMGVDRMTVWRWRATAKGICELAGVKISKVQSLGEQASQYLLLPPDEVPLEHRAVIAKLRETVLEAKSQRAVLPKEIDGEVTLDLVQCKDGSDGIPRAAAGRRKGEGGREADRPATPSELLEHEQHCATRDCHHLWLGLDTLAPRVPLVSEPDLISTIAILERWVKALKEWERTPTIRRTSEAAKALTLELKP